MNYYRDQASRILDNGFIPLPTRPKSKVPIPSQWQIRGQNGNLSDLIQVERERYSDAGIGIVCGITPKGCHVIGMDCDVEDPEEAVKAEQIIRKICGDTPLHRVGKRPKFLKVYRSEEPIANLNLIGFQVLAHHKQFIAQGIHPDTGEPYTWLGDSPADVDLEQLPLVTQAMINETLRELCQLQSIKETREPIAKALNGSGAPPPEDLQAPKDNVRSAMAAIRNDSLPWETWNMVGMALYNVSAGADWGLELFVEFSMQSSKFNFSDRPNLPGYRWAQWRRGAAATRLGFPYLRKMAEKNGWDPAPELRRTVADQDADERGLKIVEALDKEAATGKETMTRVEVLPTSESEIKKHIISEKFRVTKTQVEKFPTKWAKNHDSLIGLITEQIMLGQIEERQVAFALAAAIHLVGGLASTRFRGPTDLRTNNYTIIIGGSGSGKGRQISWIKGALRKAGLGLFLGGSDYSSDSAVLADLERHYCILAVIDEIGQKLALTRGRNASEPKRLLLSKLTELFSDPDPRGKVFSNTTLRERPTVDLQNVSMNIFGATQAETFLPLLDAGARGLGFTQRLVCFPAFPQTAMDEKFVKEAGATFKPGNDYPAEILSRLKAIAGIGCVGNMRMDVAGKKGIPQPARGAPTLIEYGKGAAESIQDVINEQKKYKAEGREMWVRTREHTEKLAMTQAVGMADLENGEPPKMTREIVDEAFTLYKWSNELIEGKAFDEEQRVPITSEMEARDRILKMLRAHGGVMSKRKLQQALSGTVSTPNFKNAMIWLPEEGSITLRDGIASLLQEKK